VLTIPSFVYSKPLTNRRHLVQITATMNVFIIFISILTFSLKTINELRVPVFNNVTSFGDNGTQLNVVQNTTIVSPVFFYSDAICNAWFTITLAIRFIFSTDRSVFQSVHFRRCVVFLRATAVPAGTAESPY